MTNAPRRPARQDYSANDVVRQSLDCVCVHDLDGFILSVNPAFALAVHAHSERSLEGTNIRDLIDPRFASEFASYIAAIKDHGKAEGTMRVLTRRGEIRAFEYRNVLQRTKRGTMVYGMARDVTEALRAAHRIARSEQRFRTLFERNVASVLITTMEGSFLDVNETTVRLLRAPSREALLGTAIQDYYADDDTRASLIDLLRRSGEVSMREIRVRRWDGSLTWAVINCAIVDYGAPYGQVILTTALDISERKETEQSVADQLRRSEHDYRALFAHAHEPLLVLEPHTELVLAANDAACRTYGVPRDELLQRTMLDFSRPGAVDRSEEVLAAAGRFVDFETVQFRSDGTEMIVEVSAGAMIYRRQPAILSINRDVTEKRRIDEERREAYARISAVAREWTSTFDAVPSPIVLVDETLRIRRVNRAAASLLDGERDADAVTKIDDLTSEPWRTIAALCRHGVDVSVEIVGGPGQRIWDVSLSVQRDDSLRDSRFIIILRDVTATHELQKSLRRVETMSAMGSLVAGVLHEVRNPLFSISATLDVLDQRGAPGAIASYVERLRADARRLQKIMADLLEYGRPHVLHKEPASLRNILDNAVAGCLPLLREKQATIDIEPVSPRINADADRLRQVFQNLIENALHHSPNSGTVRIRVREEVRWNAPWVVVTVEDEGPGFAPADLRQAFEPFFTNRSGGTGLGLSIVRKIIEEHGGTVDAENGVHGGAVLSVALRQ